MSKQELIELETKLDEEIAALPIWQLPVRCVLFAMHFALYGFFAKDGEKASTVAGRMSHLIPLLAGCPAEPMGASAADAFGAYRDVDPAIQQIVAAINYGHLSEVMPQVRRDDYSVSKLSEKRFRLDHRSSDLAHVEAKDVILSELALSHVAAGRPDLRAEIAQLASTVPNADVSLVARVLGTYIHHFLENRVEPELLSDAAMADALGLKNAELRRFTATLLAIATMAIDIARAVQLRVVQTSESERDQVEAEWLEWVSVCWTQGYVRHILRGTSGLSDEAIEQLLAIFSLDFRCIPPITGHGGDGYFPPLALISDSILIGPYFATLFAHSRNLLYAIQRLDQRKFDEVVSGDLEPQLLKEAEELLRKWRGVEVRANVVWSRGEIDLLVFEAASNTALQIQAKAAIAPYGARMVARLEDRVQEGVTQIRNFRTLSQAERDEVVSRAVGRTVTDVKFVDVVLTRSCFGSLRARKNASGICFLSLAVLRYLTRSTGDCSSATEIQQLADAYVEEVMAKANPIWTHKPLTLLDYVIDVPMLDLDQRFLDAERRRVWS